MADRFPLILNTNANQIQEIASGDSLDLTNTNISNAGIITAGNVTIGAATTDLVVNGDARVTGILTIGTSSLKLDGPNNLVNVGTALTLGHTQGLQFHTQNLHSAGFEVNQINASGIITATQADINGDLDVDGHTNLDNVSVAGVITATSFIGSGANLTGIDATSIKDPSGNVKIQAQASGAVHTGISTFGDIDVDGHTNLDNVSIAGITTMSGNLNVVNTSPFIDLTDTNNNSDYKFLNDNGTFKIQDMSNSNAVRYQLGADGKHYIYGDTAVMGSSNLTVGGNLSVGGVLTYEDVTNVDSVGLVTARDGVFLPDTKELKIGNTAASPDLKIHHTGGFNKIEATTNLIIGDSSNNLITMYPANGGVNLLYTGGHQKLATTLDGVIVTGIMTATTFSGGGLRLTDDGSASPIASIMTDDANPWGFQVGNSTYNASTSYGTMIYNSDAGYGYFSHTGNGAYLGFEFSLNNGSANHRVIKFDPTDQSVELFCGNNKKLETSSSGCTLQGTLTAQNTGYGSGSSNIEIQPYGQRGYINWTGTENFYFRTGSSYTTRWIIDGNGHFKPGSNNTYDFGSTSLRWRNIYTNDLNLSNKGSANSIDNTWGDFTIQEGESDLFLINNRSGKKYKFNLTEVS